MNSCDNKPILHSPLIITIQVSTHCFDSCLFCGIGFSVVLFQLNASWPIFPLRCPVFARPGCWWRGSRDDQEEEAAGQRGRLAFGIPSRRLPTSVLLYLQHCITLSFCCFFVLPSTVQLGWNPDPGCTSPHRWIPTPDQEEDQPVALANAGFPHYNFNNIFTTPVRCAPLPTLWWVPFMCGGSSQVCLFTLHQSQ